MRTLSLLALSLLAPLFVLLSGPQAALAQSPIPIFVSGHDRPYEILHPTKPKVETVRGPGELRLVSRARFKPAMEDGLTYSLRVRIDGGEEMVVTFEDVKRSRTAMFRDGTLGVPGRLMDFRVQLRRGYHNIEVLPGAKSPEVFFRALFKPTKERPRPWVALAPVGASKPVDLVVRESLVPYYRNAPGEPFVVEIIGPTELRVFTRTENSPEMRGRIHYRLQVREKGQVINTFQLSSRRSDVASYSSEDALVPGRASEVVIPISAGHHRLEILPLDPDKSSLLARFMLPREDLSLTVE